MRSNQITDSPFYKAFAHQLGKWSAEAYRYGFNGKEKDSDNFEGAYDFGARIMDARLGRWMSVDPAFFNYLEFSAYNFAFCSPIKFSDHSGADPIEDILKKGSGSSTFLNLMNESGINLCNFSNLIKNSTRNPKNPVDAFYRPPQDDKGKGTIFIRANSLESGVIALAHEMTNMKNGRALKAAQVAAKYGQITPEQYAETVATLESEGVLNQIKVEMELGILKPENQKAYDLINSGKEEELRTILKTNALEQVVVANGKTAKEHYIGQANKLREQGKIEAKGKSTPAACEPASCQADKDFEKAKEAIGKECKK